MTEPIKLVAYYRVSTDRQGESGLGLEGQDMDVERYRASVGGKVVKVFEEIETGTKKRHRPKIEEALIYCRQTGARLVIAKLDRLSRNVYFLSGLMETGVDFVCCDNPNATRLTLHILAAVAEDEAVRISERVKKALAAYKANGHVSKRIRAMYPDGVPDDVREATAGKLGASLPHCNKMMDEARRRGAETTARLSRERAIESTRHIAPLIMAWRNEGKGLKAIARDLNAGGFLTPGNVKTKNGKPGGQWSATQVRRVIERLT